MPTACRMPMALIGKMQDADGIAQKPGIMTSIVQMVHQSNILKSNAFYLEILKMDDYGTVY